MSRLARWSVARQRSQMRPHQIRAISPAIVYSYTFNIYTDWWAAPQLQHFGLLALKSVHIVRPHERKRPRRLETRLVRRGCSAFPRQVVALSRLADRLTGEFDLDPSRRHVVPLPVVRATAGDDGVQPSNRQPQEVGRVTAHLFFGTLRRNRDVHDYLRAIESLPNDDMRVAVAGPDDQDLEGRVRTAALRDNRVEAESGAWYGS